jgi:NADPH:quinone reductase-like Zn-dependent oxidoreductase
MNMRPYRRLLAPGGRMAAIAVASPADVAYLLASVVHGSRRVRFIRAPPTTELLADLARDVDAKSVVPVIEAVFPLEETAAVHRSLEKSGGFGKRVVQVA